MKKIVLSLALVALMLFGLVAAAEGIVPYGNPDTTLDNPQSLPYSSSFSFKEGSTTNAFKTSSGSITVKLEDAYLTTNRTAKISIKAYYWNGSTWKSSDSSSVTINNTKADYSVTLSVSANKPLYVRLSKTDYTGYYAKGTLTIDLYLWRCCVCCWALWRLPKRKMKRARRSKTR